MLSYTFPTHSASVLDGGSDSWITSGVAGDFTSAHVLGAGSEVTAPPWLHATMAGTSAIIALATLSARRMPRSA